MTQRDQTLRILLVTPLDYDLSWNNREHHLARHLSAQGCRATVLYKALNRKAGLWRLLVDSCTFRTTVRCQGSLELVRVDPWLNYYAGLRRQLDAQALDGDAQFTWRQRVMRRLSVLATWRDLFFLPCFLWAAMTRTPGRFDVAIGFGPWGALVGWVLKKLRKVRMLVYEDRDFEPGLMPDRWRYAYTAALERFGVHRADLVVCIGRKLAELRRRQTGREVRIIPTGVDWPRFAAARPRSGMGHRLIYVGNLIGWSGVESAIRAMPLIRRHHPDATLELVGAGLPGYVRHLRHLIQQLNLQDMVSLCGSVAPQQLPDVLAEADVGLANSQPNDYRRYARPLKVMEYMAAGLPVIGTTNTETALILEQYQCGVSAPYDIHALAGAVIDLFHDPARCQWLSVNGRRHAAELSWDSLLTEELSLIKQGYAQLNRGRSSWVLNQP